MDIAAAVCYVLTALIAFAFSFIYLTRSEFMPYHKDAVELSWGELDTKLQVLILALMRGAGGGWLATGISIIFLLIFPFREGVNWSLFALPLIGLGTSLPTLYATLYVKRNSQANPPVILVLAAILLLLLGFTFSLI
jgi:hypothetical protein